MCIQMGDVTPMPERFSVLWELHCFVHIHPIPILSLLRCQCDHKNYEIEENVYNRNRHHPSPPILFCAHFNFNNCINVTYDSFGVVVMA
jgi:hypothetical protein